MSKWKAHSSPPCLKVAMVGYTLPEDYCHPGMRYPTLPETSIFYKKKKKKDSRFLFAITQILYEFYVEITQILYAAHVF